MTTVYFIRHAEPNYHNHNDISRELTEKGLQDSKELVKLFSATQIDQFYSSPYKRAIDTISFLAESRRQMIQLDDNFRERKISDEWIEDFNGFTQKQWADFSYHLPHGESLAEVQQRNIQSLHAILSRHPEQTIVIGTHGTALATIIHYYKPDFLFDDFQRIKHRFPFIIRCEFDETALQSMIEIPL